MDWIGLFKAGVASTSYEDAWWEYTDGAAPGARTLSAPARGEYEFRYLLNDDFSEAARSGQITVTL